MHLAVHLHQAEVAVEVSTVECQPSIYVRLTALLGVLVCLYLLSLVEAAGASLGGSG